MKTKRFGAIFFVLFIALWLLSLIMIVFGSEKKVEYQKESSRSSIPQQITGKDGAPMLLIPAGEFQMGADSDEIKLLVKWIRRKGFRRVKLSFHDETPRHTVYLDAFYIDKYEVTVGQYKQFIKESGHKAPDWGKVSGFSPTDKHPMIYVSWHDAMAYAKWAKKRLPTEAEWEKAARGTDGREYPWGNEWDASKVRGDEYMPPVGSFPAGASPYGVMDMAGSLWEWCLDEYQKDFYQNSPKNNPFADGDIEDAIINYSQIETERVLRGGSWGNRNIYLRVTERHGVEPTAMTFAIGFRCVKPVSQ